MLSAVDPADPTASLQNVFDLINFQRRRSETYCQGRNPHYFRPAVFIVITDVGGATSRLNLTTSSGELRLEPYSWDYRVINLILTSPTAPGVTLSDSHITSWPLCALAERTGGRSIVLHSLKRLLQTMEFGAESRAKRQYPPSLGQLLTGMQVSFEEASQGGQPSRSHRVLLYAEPPTPGAPSLKVPESFWPDFAGEPPPLRSAVPALVVVPTDQTAALNKRMPRSAFDVDLCSLTAPLAKASAGVCWHVYVRNSGRQAGLGQPCALLCPSGNGGLQLHLLPYNFPTLSLLMDTCTAAGPDAPPPAEWKKAMDEYLQALPHYYWPTMVPFLQSLTPWMEPVLQRHRDHLRAASPYRALLVRMLQQGETALESNQFEVRPPRNGVRPRAAATKTRDFTRNAFDIERSQIFDQLLRMRLALVAPRAADLFTGAKHSVSIAEMSDYLPRMAKSEQPRVVDETQDVARRQPYFGNPFKRSAAMMVDEADELGGAAMGGGASGRAAADAAAAAAAKSSRDVITAERDDVNVEAPADYRDEYDQESAASTVVAIEPGVDEEVPSGATGEPVAKRIRLWIDAQLEQKVAAPSEEARMARARIFRMLRSAVRDSAPVVAEIAAVAAGDAAWLRSAVISEARRFRKTALVDALQKSASV